MDNRNGDDAMFYRERVSLRKLAERMDYATVAAERLYGALGRLGMIQPASEGHLADGRNAAGEPTEAGDQKGRSE